MSYAVRCEPAGWMAKQLFLSPDTVKHHIQHIYDKIGLSTRAGATLFAMEHNLL